MQFVLCMSTWTKTKSKVKQEAFQMSPIYVVLLIFSMELRRNNDYNEFTNLGYLMVKCKKGGCGVEESEERSLLRGWIGFQGLLSFGM